MVNEAPTLARLLAQYRARHFECHLCDGPLFFIDEYDRPGKVGICRDCEADILAEID